jgi:hypothetical protein
LDDLQIARIFLGGALESIAELRRQLRAASGVRHSPGDVLDCPTGDAPAPDQGEAFSDLIPSPRPDNRPQNDDRRDDSVELTPSNTVESEESAGRDRAKEMKQDETDTAIPATTRTTPRQLVSSASPTRYEMRDVHVWDDDDVRYEIEGAESCEAKAAAERNDERRADMLRRVAAWHRSRARAIALLVQDSDAARGWFHAENLLAPVPTRVARFHGGPFDGAELTVGFSSRRLWIARREHGAALKGAYLIREVAATPGFAPPTVPAPPLSGGMPLGWYGWSVRRDGFEWNALPAFA